MSAPSPVTVEQAHAYLEFHIQNGRGGDRLFLDRRGLQYLTGEHEPGIGMPPIEESFSADGRVFLRAVF